jgi:membrane protein required for colicin V production
MNFIDILILIFLFIFGWIGFRRGILRTIISIFGLIIGGLLAGASVPYLQNLLSDYSLLFKPIASLSFVFFGASLGMFIFGIIGSFLRVVLLPFPLLKIIDSFIGLLLALLCLGRKSYCVKCCSSNSKQNNKRYIF